MDDALGTPAILTAARDAWERHLGAPAPGDLREQLGAGSIAIAAHETALGAHDRPLL